MLPTCLRHFSPTFTSALPPHYRQSNICTDILHRHLHRQNSINLQRSQTNCKLITFAKLSQRDKNRRKGDYTLLYIGILRENGGDNVIEYQQLKSFIVQVEAFSLCKLRHFHCASWGFIIKKMVFHSSKWNTINLNFMLIIEFRN